MAKISASLQLSADEISATAYAPSASGRSRRWIVFKPHKIISWNNNNLD